MPLSAGIRYMLASTFFFSLMAVLVKIVGQRIPTQEIVLARGLVTLVLSWALLRRARISLWGTRRGLLVVRGLFGFGALSCFFYSITHLPLGEAMVIQYTSPVLTALLASVVLAERLSRRLLFPTLLSLAGVVAAARPGTLFTGSASALEPTAVLIGLAGAALAAGAYVAVRRLGQSEDPLVIVFYFSLVAVPGTIPSVAASFVMPRGIEWLVLLGVGVTTQLAQVCMTRGLQLEQAGRAMSVTYVQIVLAATWGLLFFGEVPVLWTFVGAGLVIAGSAVTALQRPAAPPAPDAVDTGGSSAVGADTPGEKRG